LSYLKRKPIPGTADFIRNRLLGVGEDYAYNVWKLFSKKLRSIGQRSPHFTSFVKYWKILEELNLIEFVREEKGRGRFPRRICRVVKANINSKDWDNPQAALDLRKGRVWINPDTGEKVPISRLGKRRYSRRVMGKPPGKPGRPPKIPSETS